jgi:hypothetical protein
MVKPLALSEARERLVLASDTIGNAEGESVGVTTAMRTAQVVLGALIIALEKMDEDEDPDPFTYLEP